MRTGARHAGAGIFIEQSIYLMPRTPTAMFSAQKLADADDLVRLDKKIQSLELQARDLARSAELVRQQTLLKSTERIEELEQKARDLAGFVESTRKQTLLQSDKKIESLEQKA